MKLPEELSYLFPSKAFGQQAVRHIKYLKYK